MRPPPLELDEVFVKLLGDKSCTECLEEITAFSGLFSWWLKSVNDEDLPLEPRLGDPNFFFNFRRNGDPSGDVSDFDFFCT